MGKRRQPAGGDAAEAQSMDIDDFLSGGFEHTAVNIVAADQQTKKKKKMAKGAVQSVPDSKPAAKKKAKVSKKAKVAPAPAGDDSSDEDDTADLQRGVRSHKEQLNALREADPEFFKYLQESDRELLAFSDDDDMDDGLDRGDEDDEDIDEDDDMDAVDTNHSVHSQAASPSNAVDIAQIEKWCKGAAEDASMGAIRQVMKAFRAACHYGDQDQHDDDHSNLSIMSSAAFQRILLFCLKEADSFFRRLLGMVGKASVTEADFKSSKWRKAAALVKSYLGNALHLLAHLAEENTSSFILRRLRCSVIFLLPFESLQRKYLKLVLGLFGTSRSRRVRLQAFLWLRAYALALPRKATDDVLKGVYRTYAAHARFVTNASLPDISFMVASIVELYGLNVAASYEHAFGFIAQLVRHAACLCLSELRGLHAGKAVLLRNALTLKTADSCREVYNWKAINCLELWGRVLAAHADKTELRPLVYPVVQLLLGAARLVPSSRWFPVRLRLVRILNAVAAATGYFVPVAPLLLEVLSWVDLSKAAKDAGQCPDLLLQLRLSKANLKQRSVQAEIVEQTLELLAGSLALSATSPAFPELTHLPTVALKRFIKASPVDRFRRQAKLLLDAIDSNARFVGSARDAVEFAPKDLDRAGSFLKDMGGKSAPLAQYARRLAEKAAEKRAASEASEVEVPLEGPHVDSDEGDADMDDEAALLPKPKKKAEKKLVNQMTPSEQDDTDIMEIPDEQDIVEEYVLSDDEEEVPTSEKGNRSSKADGRRKAASKRSVEPQKQSLGKAKAKAKKSRK